ncbi:hypothetical protein H6F42_09185 [Pseudanabaena sp. FACHB-1998]|uniref:hypothetical protein n=1 Tax=Pseudanabaena sp. FACHB-1998 TaxID=2692858 RepID=UPI0016806083|nr:hypothetical protein [Pseudanabaena sp. FACHB-1998]MBD2177082.1 hypothetical protein [Pseudanabaena sp. FACHB-1998]
MVETFAKDSYKERIKQKYLRLYRVGGEAIGYFLTILEDVAKDVLVDEYGMSWADMTPEKLNQRLDELESQLPPEDVERICKLLYEKLQATPEISAI